MKGGAKTLFWNGEVCAKWSVESCTWGPLLGRAASLLSSLQGGEGFLGPDPGCVVLYAAAPDTGAMCVLQGLFSGDPGNTHRPHLPFPCGGGETVSRNFAGSKGTGWDYGWPHTVWLKSEPTWQTSWSRNMFWCLSELRNTIQSRGWRLESPLKRMESLTTSHPEKRLVLGKEVGA